MAITISGENNNDRILAADGVIDQISGINFSGIITASHINVGSNIQLGNAGIITATTFIGNLTGNVNSTSNLLLQIGGSEKFRVGSSGQFGIAGANYGSSGQVFTSGGSGSAPSWVTPAVTGFTNGSNNRVVTATSGSGLNGESNLTYDGNTLFANGNITAASDGNRSTQGGVALVVRHSTNSAMRANHFIHDDFPTGSATYYIQATESGVTNDRNLALQGYGGKVKIGSGGIEPVETLDVSGNVKATSINLANTIFHTGDTDTLIAFTTDTIKFETAGDERLRIDSSGRIGVGAVPTAQYAHNLIQIGHQATLGANAALSVTGQTFLTHNLYFDTGGTLKVFNTSNANEGAILRLVDGNLLFSNSPATTGTPTVTERFRINADGRVHVKGSGEILTLETSASGGGQCYIDFDDETATRASIGMRGSSSDTLTLAALNGSMRFDVQNKTQAVNIDTAGRLLVNTTSSSISSSELFEVKSTSTGFSHFRNNSSSYAPIYIDNEATNDGSTLVPLITITDGGGNRAGFLMNNSSDFSISGQGTVSLATGGTVGNATERLVVETNSGIGKLKIQGEANGGTVYGLEIIGNQQSNAVAGCDAGARIIAPVARRMYFELRANDDTDHFAWLGNPDFNTGVADTILMELHPKGYLQTPLQPSFMANFGGTNNTSHNNGDYLKFSSTDHNTGNCYNTSNYRFTAPVAGNYLFYGRANMSGVTTNDYARSFQVRLYKNGSSQQYHMSRTTITGYSGSYPDTSTMVCSINLAASDYVQLRVNWEVDGQGLGTTENFHHHGSMFGGYLIG